MKNFRKISIVALILGVIGITVLIGWFGAARVAHAILSVGPLPFFLFCCWQVIVMAFLGLVWWVVAPRGIGHPAAFVRGRMVRDSAGSCLPFSVLGGLVAGARAVSLQGIRWHVAAVSTIVDITTEFGSEMAFAAMALVILLVAGPSPHIRLLAEIGLGVAAVGMVALVRLQHGVAPLFASMGKRMLAPWIAQGEIDLGAESELAESYGDRRNLALGTVMHFAGWMGKGFGNWIAFHLLGVGLSLWDAFAIEGLLHAALALAIAIPGYAGAQEAGYIALGSLFGVPADLCLSVSLIRRARDVAIGIPVLLLWQVVEVKRLKQQ